MTTEPSRWTIATESGRKSECVCDCAPSTSSVASLKKKKNENISYYSSVLYGVGFMFFSVYGAGLTWVLSWKQESFVFEGVELFKLKLIPTYWNKWKLIELFKLKMNPGHFSVYLMFESLDISFTYQWSSQALQTLSCQVFVLYFMKGVTWPWPSIMESTHSQGMQLQNACRKQKWSIVKISI